MIFHLGIKLTRHNTSPLLIFESLKHCFGFDFCFAVGKSNKAKFWIAFDDIVFVLEEVGSTDEVATCDVELSRGVSDVEFSGDDDELFCDAGVW